MDNLIEKDGKGHLQTATNSKVNWDSHHPIHLRLDHRQARELGHRFLQRGHPRNRISERPKQHRTKPLVPTYSSTTEKNGAVRGQEAVPVLKKYRDSLRADPDLADISPHYPQVICRRGRSLRDRLVHSHYTPLGRNIIGSMPLHTAE